MHRDGGPCGLEPRVIWYFPNKKDTIGPFMDSPAMEREKGREYKRERDSRLDPLPLVQAGEGQCPHQWLKREPYPENTEELQKISPIGHNHLYKVQYPVKPR